jgi:hypothetical protein
MFSEQDAEAAHLLGFESVEKFLVESEQAVTEVSDQESKVQSDEVAAKETASGFYEKAEADETESIGNTSQSSD